jgi:hypothetical protein
VRNDPQVVPLSGSGGRPAQALAIVYDVVAEDLVQSGVPFVPRPGDEVQDPVSTPPESGLWATVVEAVPECDGQAYRLMVVREGRQ